jgi:2-amino-4-hydroxy-6-hydroxymethyldihydropteridine diphosphokinase|tara:strand:+ start:3321 stop:3854 length:534 start_codon:yes stop_codon:yes gene_type:complete
VIKPDILERRVNSSYLGIGSNLGNKISNIKKAMNLLMMSNIHIEKLSSFYETPSWPNNNFPKFINVVIKINTNLSLIELFKIIKQIEKSVGRKKSLRNYPRICDIDIIDFKGISSKFYYNKNIIEIPHPRMNVRNFVIFPLFEVNNNWFHPRSKTSIYKIINKFHSSDFSDIRIVQN